MAFITGGKHFGQYTYEHWYDHEYRNEDIEAEIKADGFPGEKLSDNEAGSMRLILKNFHIVDEEIDISGEIIIDNGIITSVQHGGCQVQLKTGDREEKNRPVIIIDGSCFPGLGELPVLMPAFVDLHAHFRDPGINEENQKLPKEAPLPSETSLSPEMSLPSEVLESASLAAAAGGFGTVVCMANTKPPIDTAKKAHCLKKHSDVLGLVDLYPVLSLTKNMEGRELSEITNLLGEVPDKTGVPYIPLMLSEDGKDPADDGIFLAAMMEAKRIGIPVSCHCDFGGDEYNAVRRVIELGKKAGCHIHIAHVSTKKAVEYIRRIKAELYSEKNSAMQEDVSGLPVKAGGFALTCEAAPHHLCLTREDAEKLGADSWGRVNPPLCSTEDREALVLALIDGTIDAIATDHAPHCQKDKEKGAPGFSGFETAFAAVYTELIHAGTSGPDLSGISSSLLDLKRLSSLMSACPAEILGLNEGSRRRGRILPGYRADLVIVDTKTSWIVDPQKFKSRGKNSPFAGRRLFGKILLTLRSGRLVFES